MNTYFDFVKLGRRTKIEEWPNNKELYNKYEKLGEFWKNNSPTYDNILEIIDFVRMLRSAYFYPNRFGDVYSVIKDKSYKCPLVIDIGDNQYTVDFKAGYIFGVYNSRYIIRITLTKTKIEKWIEISIREGDNNKKAITHIKFKDGEYMMKGDEFEEDLFITIIDNLYKSTKELVDVYSNSLIFEDYLLSEDEHKNDEKGCIARTYTFLKNLLP